jgi:hypothetical protein
VCVVENSTSATPDCADCLSHPLGSLHQAVLIVDGRYIWRRYAHRERPRARLGHVDGGDIGSGAINVFAIVEPSAWEQAWAVIRTELARRNLLERAIVARDPRGDDGDEWPAVIWPEDYERRFSYW